MTVGFTVYGEPQGKGRPRFSPAGGHVRVYTPQVTTDYENLVRFAYKGCCKQQRFADGEPVAVWIDAYYGIPASAGKRKRAEMLSGKIRPTKKPDFDNIGKIVCDALNGIAYKDDAQVVDGRVRKYYSDEPRVVVTISNEAEV